MSNITTPRQFRNTTNKMVREVTNALKQGDWDTVINCYYDIYNMYDKAVAEYNNFYNEYFCLDNDTDSVFDAVWCYEKSKDRLYGLMGRLDEKIDILETRMVRKLEESKMRRGVA